VERAAVGGAEVEADGGVAEELDAGRYGELRGDALDVRGALGGDAGARRHYCCKEVQHRGYKDGSVTSLCLLSAREPHWGN
jgi:hypothetical protein